VSREIECFVTTASGGEVSCIVLYDHLED
jgi:hypothetical protein